MRPIAARSWKPRGALQAREGAGDLSLRAVAGEAGYAPASVYEYFRNRAELVLALAAEDMGSLARAVRESAAGKEGRREPLPRLRRRRSTSCA